MPLSCPGPDVLCFFVSVKQVLVSFEDPSASCETVSSNLIPVSALRRIYLWPRTKDTPQKLHCVVKTFVPLFPVRARSHEFIAMSVHAVRNFLYMLVALHNVSFLMDVIVSVM